MTWLLAPCGGSDILLRIEPTAEPSLAPIPLSSSSSTIMGTAVELAAAASQVDASPSASDPAVEEAAEADTDDNNDIIDIFVVVALVSVDAMAALAAACAGAALSASITRAASPPEAIAASGRSGSAGPAGEKEGSSKRVDEKSNE